MGYGGYDLISEIQAVVLRMMALYVLPPNMLNMGPHASLFSVVKVAFVHSIVLQLIGLPAQLELNVYLRGQKGVEIQLQEREI